MKQEVNMEQKLNDLNHDYQRMRKMGKKRINKNLTKYNKEQAKAEKKIRDRLGAESWVEVKGTWLEKVVWVLVGLLVGMWLH
jgi:hypothetical protein